MRPGRTTDVRNKSGYRGVSLFKSESGKWSWRAQSAVRGKVTHLGLYESPEEAGVAVNDEFAKYSPWRPTPNPTLPTTYVRPPDEVAPLPRARKKRTTKRRGSP